MQGLQSADGTLGFALLEFESKKAEKLPFLLGFNTSGCNNFGHGMGSVVKLFLNKEIYFGCVVKWSGQDVN